MKKSILKLTAVFIGAFGLIGQANADPITLTFTADNIVTTGGLCINMNCQAGDPWSSLGAVPNLNNWTVADSVTVDLGAGTHWFVWYVDNVGQGSATNPAGLLAEIVWGGGTNASSSAWEVTTNVNNPGSWVAATSYGNNGGNNIWTNNLGGPVAGISGDAEWLWTRRNFSREMNQFAAIRTSVTIVTAVSEPGTLALLGLSLLAIGYAGRRRVRVSS